MQLSIMQQFDTTLDTPIPTVGKVLKFLTKNFSINTIKDPANPTAKSENPTNKITRACHVVEEDPNESLFSNRDFSIEFMTSIPKDEHIAGIQSTNVT